MKDTMEYIDELEKVNKFINECDLCSLKEQRDSGDWCFIFAAPPNKKCNRIVYKRSVLESNEINNLYSQFPKLSGD